MRTAREREAELANCVAAHDDGRSGAVADGGAHRPGERRGDRAIREHLFGREDERVLRVGVHRRVPVVLGGDDRELAGRAPVATHVLAGLVGVDVHERRVVGAAGALAIGTAPPDRQELAELVVSHRLAELDPDDGLVPEVLHAGGERGPPALAGGLACARGRCDGDLVGQAGRLVGGSLHVRAREEAREHREAVQLVRLLDTEGQRHVAEAGHHVLPCAVQRRGASGARVLDVRDGDRLDPQGTQRHLAANAVLELLHAPPRVGEPDRLEPVRRQPRIGQDAAHGLGGELLDAHVRIATELRRVHSDHERFAHARPVPPARPRGRPPDGWSNRSRRAP